MNQLVLALYVEGPSDKRFLPIIIQRTCEEILAQRGRASVEVLEPLVLNQNKYRQFSTREECIVQAARDAAGCHALIVHADADDSTTERALTERFQPGYDLVQRLKTQSNEQMCEHLLAIIPVRMIEAWLLADAQALSQVIGTKLDAVSLGLPTKAKSVESDPNPKQTLKQAAQKAIANRTRGRQINIGTIFEPMARQISLERLKEVSSYQRFVEDLTQTLIALNFAE